MENVEEKLIKDIMDDVLNMTLRELMDYCSDNGLKMNFSIEKK